MSAISYLLDAMPIACCPEKIEGKLLPHHHNQKIRRISGIAKKTRLQKELV